MTALCWKLYTFLLYLNILQTGDSNQHICFMHLLSQLSHDQAFNSWLHLSLIVLSVCRRRLDMHLHADDYF